VELAIERKHKMGVEADQNGRYWNHQYLQMHPREESYRRTYNALAKLHIPF